MTWPWPTAKRWVIRYLQLRTELEAELGPEPSAAAVLAGMGDRSSRAQHSPNRTPAPVVCKIVHLRWKQRLGPVALADQVGVASSTMHAVLVRCRLNRLSHVDRATGRRGGIYRPAIGTAIVHTALDEHCRVAYAEIHDDERPRRVPDQRRHGTRPPRAPNHAAPRQLTDRREEGRRRAEQ
jgi:hypothetical protein